MGTDPHEDFDGAVDQLAEWTDEGRTCWVLCLDAATGTLMDHTAEAHAHLRARLETRGQELPDWLEDAA